MNKSNTIKELAAALCQAQKEFEAVPENAINPFLKNKYADLGSVIASAKPILVKNGLAVSQLVTSDAERVGITTILMHTSGEWIGSTVTLPTGEERGKSLAQVAGSVVTYLRRYGYSSILGLYTDEDDDGSGKARQRAEQKPAEQKQPAQNPAPEPKPAADPLAWAREVKTPGGKRYGDCTGSELTLLLEKTKDDEHKRAASALIKEMQDKAAQPAS